MKQVKENGSIWLFAFLTLCVIGGAVYYWVACGRTAATGTLEMFEATMDVRDRLVAKDQEAELDLLHRPVLMTAVQVNADGTRSFFEAKRTRLEHHRALEMQTAAGLRAIERHEEVADLQRVKQAQADHHRNQMDRMKTQMQAQRHVAELEAHRRRMDRAQSGVQNGEHLKALSDAYQVDKVDKGTRGSKCRAQPTKKRVLDNFGISKDNRCPRTYKHKIYK